jgi:tetratricopeptide (TPR) repeat protein
MPELSRAYSYRWINRPAELVVKDFTQVTLKNVNDKDIIDDAETLIDLGNRLLNNGQYRRALRNFKRAYAMIVRLINRNVRDWQIDSPIFGTIDLTESLLGATVEIIRQRVGRKWDRAEIVSPIDPPAKINPILAKIDSRFKKETDGKAIRLLDKATSMASSGNYTQALQLIDNGLEADREQSLTGRFMLLQGSVLGAQSSFDKARSSLNNAISIFKREKNTEAMHIAGKNFETLEKEEAFLSNKIKDKNQDMTNLIIPDAQGNHKALLDDNGFLSKRQEMKVKSGRVLQTLPLSQKENDDVIKLKEHFYSGRVNKTHLADLRLFDGTPENLDLAIPHLYHFVLPMALGECYLELGNFGKSEEWLVTASAYRYINRVAEIPLVWEMLSDTYMRWGHSLLKKGNRAAARARYSRIAKEGNDPVDPSSPLYRTPVFNDFIQEARDVVQGSGNPRPVVAIRVKLALLNITAIDSGVDLPLLSLAREQVPVFRFEYLQQVARYMAEQAIRAENSYMQFKNTAEAEEAQRGMLEDAVALAEANEALEDKMVAVAEAQEDASIAQRDYITEQRQNAQDARSQYSSVSWDIKELDALATWVAQVHSTDDIRVTSGWSSFGLDTGEHEARDVAFDIARRRGEINREWELDQMQRQIDNLAAAEAAANANIAVASAQAGAARERRDVARLRSDQAQDQLDAFENELFTPEVWDRLAREVKEIAGEYLERAVFVARLLEEVFEFEIGEKVTVIRNNYLSDPISGMLAGHRLLADIDSFEIHRITTLKKHHPMKMIISLSERFPFQFATQFKQTGRFDFSIGMTDLDWPYPGTYQRKIKRVDLVVEGLIGPRGVNGTLMNSGFSFTRHHDGKIQLRLLSPETFPISEYRVTKDAHIFPIFTRELASFELSPVVTRWRLEIPPRSNDLDLNLIYDVKLVVYFEALFDAALKDNVILELLDTLPTQHQMSFDLGFEFPDGFFPLKQIGEVRFTLLPSHLPFNHESPTVERLSFFMVTEEGEHPDGLVLTITSPDGSTVKETTHSGGLIATRPASPLTALTGENVLGDWRVEILQTDNQARFNTGFSWSKVVRILMTINYRYSRRSYPGDPQPIIDDDFSTDTLSTSYEVVDDPQAVLSSPSEWRYNAAQQRILQLSNIHGPVPGSNNSPDKPGTYLLYKIEDDRPILRNLLLSTSVQSADNDGIGVVFRYIDQDNFYYFLMSAQSRFRRLGKKVMGVFSELDTAAVDLATGYTPNTEYQIKIVARGSEMRAYIDNELVLTGRDTSLTAPGRAGLYTWGSQNAAFDNLKLFKL